MTGGRSGKGTKRPSGGPRLISFMGNNGRGYCAEATLRIGDEITSILDISSVPVAAETNFESVVTVNGKLRQVSTSNLSTHPFFAVVVRHP